MIEFSETKNVLTESEYKYNLQDVAEPNLYRDMFSYSEVPKCAFNHRLTPTEPPREIWITDTTFRDGQQSRAPYTVDQIVTLYKMLHKLGGRVKSASASFSSIAIGIRQRFPAARIWAIISRRLPAGFALPKRISS